MNFFRRRPLVLAISLGIIAASAAAFLPAVWKLMLMALTVLAVPAVVLILRRFDIYRICSVPSLPFMILFAVVTLCLLLTSWAFYDLYAAPYDGAYDASVHGTVIEYKTNTVFSETYVVQLDTVNGKKTNVKGLMYNEGASGLSVGDMFYANVAFEPLEDFYSLYDVSRYEMLANGHIFACETKDTPVLTGESDSFTVKLAVLRATLKAKLSLYLDHKTAALTNAMLLGDRSELGKIRRDFNYMGTSHLLAISGLHLAVLCSIFLGFLNKLRCPYQLRYSLGIVFIVAYMTITAFPVSIMRSGIMLILSYIARCIERRLDMLTALFISGGLILLADPASICDKSFALSFTATLGVLLMSADAKPFLKKLFGEGKEKRSLRNALSAVFTALGATVFILPLQWLYFGEVSLLSVPATLLMAPICELLLYLLFPYAICAILGLHFLCGKFGLLITAVTKLIEIVSDALAGLSPLISLRYPFVPLIIFIAVAVIVWMMIKDFDSWIFALIPVGSAVMLFLVCVQIWNLRFGEDTTLNYIHHKADEAIVLVSAGENMVIDVSSGSKAPMVLAEKALEETNQTEVDMLLLTHIHRKHRNSIRALLGQRIVWTLIVPEPIDKAEENLLLDILEGIEEYNVKVLYYSREDESTIKYGDVTLELPKYTKIKRSTHPLVAINFVTDSGRFSYGCGSIWENDYLWEFIGGSDRILLGQHGPVYKQPPEAIPEGSCAMVTSDHPLAQDALTHEIADVYEIDDDSSPYFLLEP